MIADEGEDIEEDEQEEESTSPVEPPPPVTIGHDDGGDDGDDGGGGGGDDGSQPANQLETGLRTTLVACYYAIPPLVGKACPTTPLNPHRVARGLPVIF